MQLADWLQVPLQPSAVRLWAAVNSAGGCAAEPVYKVLVSASPALLTQLCRWHPMVTAERSSKQLMLELRQLPEYMHTAVCEGFSMPPAGLHVDDTSMNECWPHELEFSFEFMESQALLTALQQFAAALSASVHPCAVRVCSTGGFAEQTCTALQPLLQQQQVGHCLGSQVHFRLRCHESDAAQKAQAVVQALGTVLHSLEVDSDFTDDATGLTAALAQVPRPPALALRLSAPGRFEQLAQLQLLSSMTSLSTDDAFQCEPAFAAGLATLTQLRDLGPTAGCNTECRTPPQCTSLFLWNVKECASAHCVTSAQQHVHGLRRLWKQSTGNSVASVSSSISCLPELRRLAIVDNDMQDVDTLGCLSQVQSHAAAQTRLKQLQFWRLPRKLLPALAHALAGMSSLTGLQLIHSQLADDDADVLSGGLKWLTQLQRLRLQRNMIGDAGCTAILSAVDGHQKLCSVRVNANQIGRRSVPQICCFAARTDSLCEFVVRHNPCCERLGAVLRDERCDVEGSAWARMRHCIKYD